MVHVLTASGVSLALIPLDVETIVAEPVPTWAAVTAREQPGKGALCIKLAVHVLLECLLRSQTFEHATNLTATHDAGNVGLD